MKRILLKTNKKMYLQQIIISPLSVILSLLTASGVLVHDTNVDKALTTASAAIVINHREIKPGSDPHTHPETMSLSQAVRDLKTGNNRVQPRNDNKKHLLQKHTARGHHPFDNYNLPIV